MALAGCGRGPQAASGDSVPVAAVNGLSSNTLIACRAFKGTVPVEIAPGAKQRPTSPLSDTTTAWGSPAITSRCGVKAGSPLDDPYTFNGVQWAMHDNGASRLWTTLGRKVNVVIEVPDSYSSQAELIGRLADAVGKRLS
ncbi:MAG: hypothetical protein JWO12_82 [Frankiales bacterium]|nr:hypothetical protein [Frankiales bacterium]